MNLQSKGLWNMSLSNQQHLRITLYLLLEETYIAFAQKCLCLALCIGLAPFIPNHCRYDGFCLLGIRPKLNNTP